jgi:hypothetical protein
MKTNFSVITPVLLAFTFFFLQSALLSQSCANYVVTRATGITFTSISSTGSSFIWRNTSGTATNDDNRSIPADIGFDFWYLGIRYTSFCASLNGFIDFSTNANVGTAGAAYGPLNGNEFSVGGTGGTMLALAPLYDDIWPSNAGTGSVAGSVVYKTTGTAPNRVLTVEWVHMEIYKAAPYWSPSPDLNFQVKIYETSGLIEFVYGTMTIGAASHNYAVGINNFWTPAAAPTAAQHLTQQTANTTSFNNTPQDALTTYPTSNSKLTFTPPAPSAAPSALAFSSVTKTSMNLAWTDNANNELGYVILNSTDNVNFYFVNQFAANTNNASVTGLTAGTTYFWRVHAVTEGNLGTSVNGTQATLAGGTIVSIATGGWSSNSTWNCSCIPGAGDNVSIANTHVVTLDVDAACNNLTVGGGTSGQLTLGNNGTNRNIVISGNLLIQNGATIITGNNNATHQMTVTGNIVNSGIFNLSSTASKLCNLTLNRDGNQSISGTGGTTFFSRITMSMGNTAANVLDITTTAFGVRATNFLTINAGTFKMSASAGAITPFTGATTFSTNAGIWLNNSGTTLLLGNSLTTSSGIRVSAGSLNVGDASNENLIINGGSVIIDGGNLNVAGRLARLGLTSRMDFTLSSGAVVLGTSGSSTAGEAIFRNDELGSSFSMTGGSITLRRSGASNLGFVNTSTTNVNVTGGTVFIGDGSSPAAQIITINSSAPIQNLVLNASVPQTAQLQTSSLTVNNNINISGGTLNANNLDISLRGNWTNDAVFTAGTGSVVFNGTSAQSISGASGTSFANLTIANSAAGGVTCSAPIDVSAALQLSNGKLTTDATNLLSMGTSATANAGSSTSYVNGPMQKAGTAAFVFPVGKGGRWARIGISAPSSASTFFAEYFNTSFISTIYMATTPTPRLNNVSKIEYWQLDRTVGTGNARVTLFWEDANFSDINNCGTTDLRVAHWNTTAFLWENNNNVVTTTGACTGVTPGSVSTSAVVTSFSPFTFGSLSSGLNPLPIELLNFDAALDQHDNVVSKWKTASEKDCDFFTVEKTKDGVNFEFVGKVKGSGTTDTQHEYTLLDESPFEGTSYYRLKQTDFDGTSSFFPLVNVMRTESASVSVFPNPNDGKELYLSVTGYSGSEITLALEDELGRISYTETLTKTPDEKTVKKLIHFKPELRPGIYTCVITIGQEVTRHKLVVSQ